MHLKRQIEQKMQWTADQTNLKVIFSRWRYEFLLFSVSGTNSIRNEFSIARKMLRTVSLQQRNWSISSITDEFARSKMFVAHAQRHDAKQRMINWRLMCWRRCLRRRFCCVDKISFFFFFFSSLCSFSSTFHVNSVRRLNFTGVANESQILTRHGNSQKRRIKTREKAHNETENKKYKIRWLLLFILNILLIRLHEFQKYYERTSQKKYSFVYNLFKVNKVDINWLECCTLRVRVFSAFFLCFFFFVPKRNKSKNKRRNLWGDIIQNAKEKSIQSECM